jgi:biopolymer transport protein ExbD
MDNASSFKFEPAGNGGAMGIPIAPLIDIVFLLICFFMLATQLVQTQADPSVQLPAMSESKADREIPAEIIVNVRNDGTLLINGQTLAMNRLTGYLASQAARSAQVARAGVGGTSGTSEAQPLRVVIRADRRQRFDRLDKVLDACRQAGIDQVILRAEREETR